MRREPDHAIGRVGGRPPPLGELRDRAHDGADGGHAIGLDDDRIARPRRGLAAAASNDKRLRRPTGVSLTETTRTESDMFPRLLIASLLVGRLS